MENTAITIFTITEFGNMRRFKRWSTIEVLLQSASMAATWLSVMTNRLMISSLVPWLMLRGLSTRERIFSRSSANRYEPVRIAPKKSVRCRNKWGGATRLNPQRTLTKSVLKFMFESILGYV